MIRNRGKTKVASQVVSHLVSDVASTISSFTVSHIFPYRRPYLRMLSVGLAVPLLFCQAGKTEPASKPAAQQTPVPAARIAVAPLGYQPPGMLYLLSGMSLSSLDFIDSNHLLFTFHQTALLRRTNSDPDEEEQMIHAVVLSIPDGRVTASADWLMEDKDRFLWPLDNGRFLVRQGGVYSTTDASLRLQMLVSSPNPVRLTEVSPDGKLLVVEQAAEAPPPQAKSQLKDGGTHLGDPTPGDEVIIDMLDVDSRRMIAAIRFYAPIVLPVTSAGYLGEFGPQGNSYQLRFMPFEGKPKDLGIISSDCGPQETFVSSNALLIQSCRPNTDGVSLDLWTLDGRKIWHGVHDRHEVWPTFATARNGSRFAIGFVRASHPLDLENALGAEDVKGQPVEVYDTGTGAVLLKTDASPVLTGGQNFALSPDGSRFAILRRGAIEIYDLPPAAGASSAQK